MTALVFWGCLFTAFSPAAAMVVLTIAKHPLRIILLVVGAFFWLISLLASSLVWLAVVPLRDDVAFGLFIGVALQEVFRLLLFKLMRKAEVGLQGSLSEEEQKSISKHAMPYVVGLGFGLMSGCFSILNLLSLSHGPGNVGIRGDKPNFFLVSAFLTNAFILLNTFWTIIFFDGILKKRYFPVITVVASHLLISGLTLLNKSDDKYLISLIGSYLLVLWSMSWSYKIAGGSLRNIKSLFSALC